MHEWVQQYRTPLTAEDRRKQYLSHRDYRVVHERTGLLRLRLIQNISGYRDWTEDAERPLEGRLNDVIVGMLKEVARKREREAKWAEAARLREEVRRRELEAAERRRQAEEARRKEEERVQALLDEAASWRRAADLRAYVAAYRETRKATATQEFDAWGEWALRVADKIDPIVSAELRARRGRPRHRRGLTVERYTEIRRRQRCRDLE